MELPTLNKAAAEVEATIAKGYEVQAERQHDEELAAIEAAGGTITKELQDAMAANTIAAYAPVPLPATHPSAEKLASKVSGLTADEILAGLMPEISALYRAQEAAAATIADYKEMQQYLTDKVTQQQTALSSCNEEVNLAYNAGVDVENRLAKAMCDRHLANIHITVISAERDSYLTDIQQAHRLLCDTLVRLRAYTEVESENEYRHYLGRMTLLKVVEELVTAAITPDDFRDNFVKRVAKLRKESPAMQATDGGSNEQDTSAE